MISPRTWADLWIDARSKDWLPSCWCGLWSERCLRFRILDSNCHRLPLWLNFESRGRETLWQGKRRHRHCGPRKRGDGPACRPRWYWGSFWGCLRQVRMSGRRHFRSSNMGCLYTLLLLFSLNDLQTHLILSLVPWHRWLLWFLDIGWEYILTLLKFHLRNLVFRTPYIWMIKTLLIILLNVMWKNVIFQGAVKILWFENFEVFDFKVGFWIID